MTDKFADPERCFTVSKSQWDGARTALRFMPEQAAQIAAAAALELRAQASAEQLDEALGRFMAVRTDHVSDKEALDRWREAQKTGKAFLLAIGKLPEFEIRSARETVNEFLTRCAKLVRLLESVANAEARVGIKDKRRADSFAAKELMTLLAWEFDRLFRHFPAATKGGPFDRFVRAFLEKARPHLAKHERQMLPSADTVLDHLANNLENIRRLLQTIRNLPPENS